MTVLETPRRRGRGLRLLLALLVLTVLAWVLLLSSLLAVDRVVVTGAARVGEAQVLAAARVRPGTPLARVDVGGVRRRVDALAPVDRVEVRRSWPSTLRLRVVERTAEAGIVTGGTARLIDDHGVVFATEPRLPPGLVRLQVAHPGPSDPTTRAALAVLHEVPDELHGRVAIVRAGSPGSVSLLLRDGRQVVWGAPGRAVDKAAAAEALLRLPGSVYDVTSPDVVVRRQAPDAALASGMPTPSSG